MPAMSPELRASKAAMKRLWVEILPQQMRARLQTTIDAQAEIIAESQRALAPRQSGDLVDSIKVTHGDAQPAHPNVRGVQMSGGTPRVPSANIVAGDEKAYYAGWVEWGTVNAPAHPYFWPAWRAKRPGAVRAINRTMASVLADMSAS